MSLSSVKIKTGMIIIMPVLLESRITVFPTMSVCSLFFYLKTKKVLTKVALSDNNYVIVLPR